MRNLLFVAFLATAALSMGCNGIHKRGGCGGGCGGCGGCGACGGGQGGGLLGHCGGGGQYGTPGVPHHQSREYLGPQGPPTAQVAYPYYTTRGPRDYFANQPMSIGY